MSLSYNSLCLRKRDAFRLQLQFSDSKRASFKIIAIVLLFAFCPNHTWANSYQVHIEGIQNDELLRIIDSSSQLKKLQDSPPSTSLGLKRRAEGDIANIIDALHSRAYYGASVDLSIAESIITLHIDPGPIYPLSAFNIRYMQNEVEISESMLPKIISLTDLNIKLGEPALPATILSAEDKLLDKLNLMGYAFAKIKTRDVFADQQGKTVIVWIVIETGPLSYFGTLKIDGIQRVKEAFFYKKLRWKEGEIYDPCKIEKTEESLELSGLFRTVTIAHSGEPLNGNQISIEISAIESKQRSIGGGLSYTTSLGPGFSGEWEDRNILGEGQKLSFRTAIWEKLQEGSLAYLIPDFKRQNQNLIWLLDYTHERTKSFIENAVSFSVSIERKINDNLRISYGGMLKRLKSERSEFNGTFNLIKIPLQLRWSNADNILEPTKGASIQFKTIPSLQLSKHQFAYFINTFTGSAYQTLTKDKRHIFAVKFMLGSIVGANKHEIPPPERFYAGSDSSIRGYHYLTVSPLDKKHKPLGGRSLFVYSIELRNRIGENFGYVFFYDIGNVYENAYPDFKDIMRQSLGLGLRYYTPIGPLRLDVALPLNRRKIDGAWQGYFSIGQSF